MSSMELSLARSASKVADRSQALKCRQHVWEFINKYMEKLNLESEWKLLLNYITETVVHCPAAFISIPQPSNNVPNQDHEFVLWLFSCLLKLLALPECEGLHQRIAECLDGILLLAKSRDHPLFSYMMEEFIHLASDLAKLDQQWLDNELQFPVYLSHFQFSWGKMDQDGDCRKADEEAGSVLGPLDPQLLEAHSPEHVTLLFLSVMRLSGRFVDEICQAPPLSVHQLFHALSSSIQFSGLKTKKCALVLLEQLLARKAPVDKPTKDHIVWCFIAVLSVVTRKHLTAEGDIPVELEISLASCLNSLFCPREGEPQAVLRFWDPLLSTLQSGLAQGSYPYFCHEMQVCIGELLFRCCQLRLEQSKYTAEAALQTIGKARDLQPLVACLWYLLHTKLMSKQAPISTEHKETDDATQSRQHSSDSGRKKLSIKGVKAKSARVLPLTLPLLAALLAQKALQCARQASALRGNAEMGDELLCSLEGVHLVLDVCARVVLSCSERLPCPLLTSEQLGSLCHNWEGSLCDVAQHWAGLEEGETFLDEVLAKIIDSAGAVTSISDCIPITSVILDRLLWLIGLPWLQVDESTPVTGDLVAGSSLTREQCQQIRETTHQLSRATYSKTCSLKVLAAFPQHVGKTLKLRGFQQACVDGCDSVRVALVSTIPAVLTSIEKEMASTLFASLINMKLETSELQLILAKELPSIVFAVSRQDVPRRFSLENHCLPVHHTVRLTESTKDSKIEAVRLLPVIEKLIATNNPDVVQALIESLLRIAPLTDDPSVISSPCIPLFTNECQQVRNAISKHILLFFPNHDPPATVAELENHPVISKLREAFRIGAKNCNSRLQEFSVISFGQIGKFADGNLLVTCIIALLKLLLDPALAVRAAASVQVHRVAKAHTLTPGKMLSLFKDNVCQFLVEVLHQKKGFILKADKKGPFYQVALAFGQKDLKQFFEAIKDILIPLLVCRAAPESSEALKFVAKMTNTAEYLQPHIHGVVAFLNFILIRLEYFENSRLSRGKVAIGSLIELMKLGTMLYEMKVLAVLIKALSTTREMKK